MRLVSAKSLPKQQLDAYIASLSRSGLGPGNRSFVIGPQQLRRKLAAAATQLADTNTQTHTQQQTQTH